MLLMNLPPPQETAAPETTVDNAVVSAPAPRTFRRQAAWSVALVALVGGVGAFFLHPSASAKPDDTPSPAPHGSTDVAAPTLLGTHLIDLSTGTVGTDAHMTPLSLAGQVVFAADHLEKVSPRLSGRLRDVRVQVGDRVRTGQVLALMDSTDAASAAATLRQAENRLMLAQQAQIRANHQFSLGTQDVTSAQALLDQENAQVASRKAVLERTRAQARIGGFSDKPLEDARTALAGATSDLAQAQTDVAAARREQDRAGQLARIGVGARKDADAASDAAAKADAALSATQEKKRLATQAVEREEKAFQTHLYSDQSVQAAESDYQQAQLARQAAARAVTLARTSVARDVQQAASDVRAAEQDVRSARAALQLMGQPQADGTLALVSPASGVVTDRSANSGQVVDPSQTLFTIADPTQLWVDASLPESDAARVHLGQSVLITDAALARPLPARVTYIAPQMDKNHAVHLRASVRGEGQLKDGSFVTVRVPQTAGSSRLVVPLTAIVHQGESDFVLVPGKDGAYKRQAVRLGEQRGEDKIEVLSGVRAGDTIVTRGALFLAGEQ